MLRIIMFKNLGFERLRITSPRLYLTKVKNFFFKKTGGVGMANAGSITRANLLRPGHQKKVRKKADKN